MHLFKSYRSIGLSIIRNHIKNERKVKKRKKENKEQNKNNNSREREFKWKVCRSRCLKVSPWVSP